MVIVTGVMVQLEVENAHEEAMAHLDDIHKERVYCKGCIGQLGLFAFSIYTSIRAIGLQFSSDNTLTSLLPQLFFFRIFQDTHSER